MLDYQSSKTEMGHDVHQFTAAQEGPHVLVFGAIHGDEVCGPRALPTVIEALKDGTYPLKKGKVTIIPVCNLQAHENDTRYVDVNLNRVFAYTDQPSTLEAEYANTLIPFIEQADYLIDLHSTDAGGGAFVFDDQETEMSGKITDILPLPYILMGWDALYPGDCGISTISASDKYNCTGVCIENGQHKDPAAIETARQSVLSILNFLGVIDADINQIEPGKRLLMTEVLYRKDMGARFTKTWQNFDKITEGEVIGTCPEYGEVKAPYDGYMIMPKDTAPVGEEWLYFAKEVA